jgi:hypothetical protein
MLNQSSETINEEESIGQACQRIRYFPFRDIRLRSCHTRGSARGIAHGETPAQHPPEAPVLVQQTMFALKVRGQAFLMGGDFILDALSIRVVYSAKPFL